MNVMANDLSTLIPDTQRFLDKDKKHFIGGKWLAGGSKESIPVIDPSSAEILSEIPLGTIEDIDNAVQAAYTALNDPVWRDMPPANRERMMHRFADLIEGHAEEENVASALNEVEQQANLFRVLGAYPRAVL